MRSIQIEAKPDAARLSGMKVNVWKELEKSDSVIPWKYFEDETSYILEGRAVLIPEGGAPMEINKGNLVTIPCGTTCVWKIIEPIRKRYRIGAA